MTRVMSRGWWATRGATSWCRYRRLRVSAALNAHLEGRCLERMDAVLRGHTETIGQRMERDLDALLHLPAVPYDACDRRASRVSSLSLVRYRTNDYSVPVAYGHRDVLIRGYVDEVVISCGAEVIARHPRSYEQNGFVFARLYAKFKESNGCHHVGTPPPVAGVGGFFPISSLR